MDAVNIIALSMGAAWASGINLYATIFMLGYMGMTGNITLPDELQMLSNPMVMAAAGFMYCVEFFADKIPGIDSGWDSIHTFIRIPAGAMLAASAVGDVTPAVELSAALLGGSLAAGSHATKAGSRLLINTSPEPVSNWGASIGEDLLVIGGLWAALNHPVLFLIALVFFIVLMIWLLPRLWRLIKALCRRVGSWLGMCEPPPTLPVETLKADAPKVVNKDSG
ncbi:DUF4126 domain-containing protein [Methylophaga thiooxydans]|uniref:DUF4126 domain-containing protein n=1 Tax=Methylophaga thiooxydans DMS010 TaxID=637616 RepID=C0N8Q2_9GAMM|nr:DUF4126 domain-containing protein [Methylophaga thiooxydans]EEF78821.1 hypothetical protein MDMS009_2565 [Methylophaga thiooxydans DMS010]